MVDCTACVRADRWKLLNFAEQSVQHVSILADQDTLFSLQVGLASVPATSNRAADSTASLPGSSHHPSELSGAGREGSLRAAADDPGSCGDGVALDASSTMSISPSGDPC